MVDLRLYKERDLGSKARSLSEDPAFSEAVKRLREKMMNGWQNSKSDEVEEREELFRMMKLLDSVTKELDFMIDDGKVAEARIELDESNG